MKILLASSLLALTPVIAQQANFELADVHASPTKYWFAQNTSGTARQAILRDGLYIYRDATVLGLIEAAYGVPEDAVFGGPSWLKSDLFDVVAKTPEGTTLAAANQMLQPLLADRFGLVLRQEDRPAPRYVLSVGKGGSKLKRSTGQGEAGCKQEMAGVPGGRGGDVTPASIPNMKVTCHAQTSQQIADGLHQMAGGYTTYMNHEVMDSTKLEGAWDFELEFTPSQLLADKGRDGITIFDAVNKQLGLRLQLEDVPVASLVVASVNRQPTPNSPEAAKALALPPARFEVAIVRPVDPSKPPLPGNGGASQLRFGGTLRMLISQSFQIQPNAAADEVIGLPKSADSQVWEVTAKLPSTGDGAPYFVGGRQQPPLRSVVLEMLRGVLIDQFELKTHMENREITVYALTADNGKLKMTKADPSDRSDCIPDPNAPKPFPNIGTMARCTNITMDEFARNLEQATGFFDHPIVNETGLQGGWSFLLGWSRQRAERPPSANTPGAIPDASDDAAYLSAYDAVQKELGVKLIKVKRSIPVIVVHRVRERPVD